MDDESRHNKPSMPITKAAVEAIKARAKALDARPIKKVAEAKARKKYKAGQKLKKLKAKMGSIVEDEETPDGVKARELRKLQNKAGSVGRESEKNKVKLVVAKGSARGVQGRPKGVKGRYKVNFSSLPFFEM